MDGQLFGEVSDLSASPRNAPCCPAGSADAAWSIQVGVEGLHHLGFGRVEGRLGAFLFLIQRGIAAGITIYAPAIILSALLGWRLNLTIWLAGGLVDYLRSSTETKIVSITQRYQIVILVGMAIAFAVAVYRLSPDLSFNTLRFLAGKWES